jgi:hypothetical protein
MNKKTTRLFQTITILTISFLALSFIPANAFSQDYDSGWRMTVNGAVGNTLTLSINDLAAMPATTIHAALFCDGNLITEGDWTGVTLGQLCSAAQVNAQGKTIFFGFTASDTYAITLTSEDHPNWAGIIIAYQENGLPLADALRLIRPGENGPLWISKITLLTITLPESSTPAPTSGTETPQGAEPIVTPTPTQTPTQSPGTEPENQTNTQPSNPPADSQTLQQIKQNSASSTPNYIITGLIFVAVIFAIGVIVLLIWKSKKI